MRNVGLFLCFLLLSACCRGQAGAIFLINPSLEGRPGSATLPVGWYFCGHPGESPPDLHPAGVFQVKKEPYEGETYVGMVVRDNDTWEAIGLQLPSPLQGGHCYQFRLRAARSENYISVSRSTMNVADFTTPAGLRIWGGDLNCRRRELLAASEAITQHDWQEISFSLRPSQDHSHLIIEAFYTPDTSAPYNGHVLIDGLFPFIPVDCETGKMLVSIDAIGVVSLPGETGLSSMVTREGRQVAFVHAGRQLEHHLFFDENGKLQAANRHLWQIGRALSQFPKQKLLVAVATPNDPFAPILLGQIRRSLEKGGLSKKQLRLRAMNKADSKREWLWKNDEPEILMQLGRKHRN